MTKDEALKLALEALECTEHPQDHYDAITAIKEALAQPQQKPVDSPEKAGAYMDARLWEFIDMAAAWPESRPDSRTWDHVMVYAPTPRRPWVGLTDEERLFLHGHDSELDDLISVIEAKLKAKNAQKK